MAKALKYKHDAQASGFRECLRTHSLALRACIRVWKSLTAFPAGVLAMCLRPERHNLFNTFGVGDFEGPQPTLARLRRDSELWRLTASR